MIFLQVCQISTLCLSYNGNTKIFVQHIEALSGVSLDLSLYADHSKFMQIYSISDNLSPGRNWTILLSQLTRHNWDFESPWSYNNWERRARIWLKRIRNALLFPVLTKLTSFNPKNTAPCFLTFSIIQCRIRPKLKNFEICNLGSGNMTIFGEKAW